MTFEEANGKGCESTPVRGEDTIEDAADLLLQTSRQKFERLPPTSPVNDTHRSFLETLAEMASNATPIKGEGQKFAEGRRPRAMSEPVIMDETWRKLVSPPKTDTKSPLFSLTSIMEEPKKVGGLSEMITPGPQIPHIFEKAGRIGIYTKEERSVIIAKFYEKRKRRVWNKKIRYNCRKNLAERRVRVKGRFVRAADREKMMIEEDREAEDGDHEVVEGSQGRIVVASKSVPKSAQNGVPKPQYGLSLPRNPILDGVPNGVSSHTPGSSGTTSSNTSVGSVASVTSAVSAETSNLYGNANGSGNLSPSKRTAQGYIIGLDKNGYKTTNPSTQMTSTLVPPYGAGAIPPPSFSMLSARVPASMPSGLPRPPGMANGVTGLPNGLHNGLPHGLPTGTPPRVPNGVPAGMMPRVGGPVMASSVPAPYLLSGGFSLPPQSGAPLAPVPARGVLPARAVPPGVAGAVLVGPPGRTLAPTPGSMGMGMGMLPARGTGMHPTTGSNASVGAPPLLPMQLPRGLPGRGLLVGGVGPTGSSLANPGTAPVINKSMPSAAALTPSTTSAIMPTVGGHSGMGLSSPTAVASSVSGQTNGTAQPKKQPEDAVDEDPSTKRIRRYSIAF